MKRRPEITFLAGLCFLFLGLELNVLLRNNEVPELLRYLPSDASAFVITSPINELWRNAEFHLKSFVEWSDCKNKKQAAHEAPLHNLLGQIKCKLEKNKFPIRHFENIEENGIDATRSMLLALRGPLRISSDSSVLHTPFVLTIPVSDKKKFTKFIDDLHDTPVVSKVQFAANIADNSTQNRIIKKVFSKGRIYKKQELCGHDVSPNKAFQHSSAPDPTLFMVTSTEDIKLLQDIENYDKKDENISENIDLMPSEESVSHVKAFFIGSTVSANEYKDTILHAEKYLQIFPVDSYLCIAYPEPNIAILFNDRDLFIDAIRDTDANLSEARKSDFLNTRYNWARDGAKKTNLDIFAHANQLGVPLLDATTLGFRFLPNSINLRVSTELETFGSTFLKRLFHPGGSSIKNIDKVPISSGVTGRLSNQDLGYFVRYLNKINPEVINDTRQDMGRYGVLLDILQENVTIDQLEVFLTGIREGIPEFAFAIKIDATEAYQSIKRIQSSLRMERDAYILMSAQEEYQESERLSLILNHLRQNSKSFIVFEDQFGPFRSVEQLGKLLIDNKLGSKDDQKNLLNTVNEVIKVVESAEISTPTINTLISQGQIEIEPYALWTIIIPEEDGWYYSAPQFDNTLYHESDFENSQYSGCLTLVQDVTEKGSLTQCEDDLVYRYIMPPFTTNDFHYRANPDKKINKEALFNDRYRLVSVYEQPNHRLWLALDLPALKKVFVEQEMQTSEQFLAAHPDDMQLLGLSVDPSWTLEHVQLAYPDKSQENISGLLQDFKGYKSLNISVVGLDNAPGMGVIFKVIRE